MIYDIADGYFVRALKMEDLDGPYPSWFEDQEVCKYNRHGKFPKNRKYFVDYILSLNREDSVVWAICHNRDGHIGNIALEGISLLNRSADFVIIMGEREHWGKGVGRSAGHALLAHSFDKLNLYRIGCGTAAGNVGMRQLALSLGMQQEGIRRKALFLDGDWQDVIEFGVLRDEYRRF